MPANRRLKRERKRNYLKAIKMARRGKFDDSDASAAIVNEYVAQAAKEAGSVVPALYMAFAPIDSLGPAPTQLRRLDGDQPVSA